MRMHRHSEGFLFARSLLAALVISVITLSPLVLLTALSGCSSGSDGENPPPDDGTNEPILCPCSADVYIDALYPDENMDYMTTGTTRILLATYRPTKGISRGLFLFDIPETLTAADVQEAQIFLSGCSPSHCESGFSGVVRFYALNIPFIENGQFGSTWYSLDGGDWDDSVHTEATLPEGTGWNEAVNGQPQADAQGFDITLLLQNNLGKVRENGIMMRFVKDEVQYEEDGTYYHQNVASRESPAFYPDEFAPFISITLKEE